MLANELITKLQELVKDHGNIPVMLWDEYSPSAVGAVSEVKVDATGCHRDYAFIILES